MVPGVFAVWARNLLETAALAPGIGRWMWLVALVLSPVRLPIGLLHLAPSLD